MPNTPAAKKSIRRDQKREKNNRKRKQEMKKLTKKVSNLVDQGEIEQAREALPELYKAIDKAAENNVIKDNTAARKKAKIAKYIDRD